MTRESSHINHESQKSKEQLEAELNELRAYLCRNRICASIESIDNRPWMAKRIVELTEILKEMDSVMESPCKP